MVKDGTFLRKARVFTKVCDVISKLHIDYCKSKSPGKLLPLMY